MRRFLVVLGCSAFFGAAWAAGLMEVVPEGRISVAVNQVKSFRFDEPISRVDVTTKGTIEAAAQSDRQISIQGVAVGETQMFVSTAEGKRLYGAIVTVTSESGHIVRIYGSGKNDDVNAGFSSVYCNEVACGRPDRDLPVPNVTVERISRGPKDKY